MATRDNQEESTTATTARQENQQPLHQESVAEHKSTGYCHLTRTLTPLIALAALAIAGYANYNTNHLNQNVLEENRTLSGALHLLQKQQRDIEQQLDTHNTSQQHASQDIEQKIVHITQQVHTLLSQKGNQNQDWLLLKARYYLELAQINAHWNSTAKDDSTIELLQQADIILGQINSAELFKIRQIIAQEILALKTANTLDVPGLLSQLDALRNSVSQLNTQTPINFDKELAATEKKTQTNQSAWKKQLQNSFDALSKLVVIRHNDEEIKPLLSPLYESVLKESIRLNIQEAQWAIINTNSVAYQFSLNQAEANLKSGFNQHLSATTTLLHQLIKLQKIQLNPVKPEIGQALPLLNQLIQQQKRLPIEEKAEKEQGL